MPLIDASTLRTLLTGSNPVLLDVRWSLADGADHGAYSAGHVPGAVFVDVDEDLCGRPGPDGRHPLPEVAALQDRLRRSGIAANSAVVVYDGGDMLAAARAWWTLRWAGIAEVKVLDGGYPAWIAADGPVSTDEVTPQPGDIVVTPGSLPVLDAAGAAEWAEDRTLVDVRAAARYRGEVEPIDPVAGHIPGAVNHPDTDLIAPGGGFINADARRRELADLPRDIAVYCGSGITAARAALAVASTDRPIPPVYIGSWSGWIASGDRPVARGEAAAGDLATLAEFLAT
ncbi:sulfurtransferase [Stackebrandtia soli]|uniref:sulfurtransferase n=1 Tax=Stackebrandtia soli TaxID=1892856 RepID=UPI0039E931F8